MHNSIKFLPPIFVYNADKLILPFRSNSCIAFSFYDIPE